MSGADIFNQGGNWKTVDVGPEVEMSDEMETLVAEMRKKLGWDKNIMNKTFDNTRFGDITVTLDGVSIRLSSTTHPEFDGSITFDGEDVAKDVFNDIKRHNAILWYSTASEKVGEKNDA